MRARRGPLVFGLAMMAAVMLPLSAVAAKAGGGAGFAGAVVGGTSPVLVQGARDLGPSTAPALSVTMVLPLRNAAGLQALIRRQRMPGSSDFRRFLTPGEFASRFAPSDAAVASRSPGTPAVAVSRSPRRCPPSRRTPAAASCPGSAGFPT